MNDVILFQNSVTRAALQERTFVPILKTILMLLLNKHQHKQFNKINMTLGWWSGLAIAVLIVGMLYKLRKIKKL